MAPQGQIRNKPYKRSEPHTPKSSLPQNPPKKPNPNLNKNPPPPRPKKKREKPKVNKNNKMNKTKTPCPSEGHGINIPAADPPLKYSIVVHPLPLSKPSYMTKPSHKQDEAHQMKGKRKLAGIEG